MQAVIPIMREHGGGMIINISSMVSKMRIPGLAAYAATKSALNMLSDTARVELARKISTSSPCSHVMTRDRFPEEFPGKPRTA